MDTWKRHSTAKLLPEYSSGDAIDFLIGESQIAAIDACLHIISDCADQEDLDHFFFIANQMVQHSLQMQGYDVDVMSAIDAIVDQAKDADPITLARIICTNSEMEENYSMITQIAFMRIIASKLDF